MCGGGRKVAGAYPPFCTLCFYVLFIYNPSAEKTASDSFKRIVPLEITNRKSKVLYKYVFLIYESNIIVIF